MTKENRRHKRFTLHWRIGLLYENPQDLELFYATTNSISMTGCSIYLDRHILVEHPVTVHLTIPSAVFGEKGEDNGEEKSGEAGGEQDKHVKIIALMKYGYLCRARLRYRVGLNFIDFLDDGKQLMEEAFANIT